MQNQPKQLRIISGKWRGRKISFALSPELRPTPDRVRETLFNWLAPYIKGAKCLDCFAGSGALGLEALSRGAAFVTMIDKSKAVINNLKENAQNLDATNIDFYCAKFPTVKIPLANYDIIFLDPPYHQNLIALSSLYLANNNCLAKNALIYIEAEKKLLPLPIPKNWRVLKSKIAGQVRYHLVST